MGRGGRGGGGGGKNHTFGAISRWITTPGGHPKTQKKTHTHNGRKKRKGNNPAKGQD